MTIEMIRRSNQRRAEPLLVTLAFAATLTASGCVTPGNSNLAEPAKDGWINTAQVDRPSVIPILVHEGQKALAKNELEQASRIFNAALKLDVTNADLQFLNAFVYHLMGITGDSTKFELAEEGLKLALKFDPGHLAARYQLGLLYMDQRRYQLAQGHFAAVALHRGSDPRVLYNLASSSYYARDPRTAEAALNQLANVAPEVAARPDVLRAQAMTKAALNDPAAAQGYLDSFRAVAKDAVLPHLLEQRLGAWRAFYEHGAKVLLAQANPFGASPQQFPAPAPAVDLYGSGTPQPPFGTPSTPLGLGGQTVGTEDALSQMVVVDVVLIGTQEDARESRGVNLLNGLQLQFGDPLTGLSGFRFSDSRVKDNLSSGLEESTQTITRSIGIPAVTYSLNIANSADANNEILAKPSLVAQSGQTSEFFSGTEILAAAVSGGDGDSVSVQKEVGVKLAVTPVVLGNDLLRLHVVAERTFLTDPANSVVFEFRLDTTKTNVNATVTMRYGETLILGGLSERETSRSDDGVPFLKDIPGVNLFFSDRSERQFQRSILILMTPRRPQYTRQSAADREAVKSNQSALEQDLERLNEWHGDWYTPRPTFNEIIDKLQTREFFEEFRSGDVKINAWDRGDADTAHVDLVRYRLTEK